MTNIDYNSLAQTLLIYSGHADAATDPAVLPIEDIDHLIGRGFLYRESDGSVGFTTKGDEAIGRLLDGEAAGSVLK